MSAETADSSINSFDNFEESVEERRIRLHYEMATIPGALHELEIHHNTLTLGLIALAQTGDLQAHKMKSKERDNLAQEIAKLRREQAQLIIDIANCNRTIWRPGYGSDQEKAERARIEHPYVVHLYNGGENPLQNEPHDRYLTRTAE